MYHLLGNVAEDVQEEGWRFAFESNGWKFARTASTMTLLAPVNFPAVAFNRATRAVQDALKNGGNPLYTVLDASVYNQWTTAWRRRQGID